MLESDADAAVDVLVRGGGPVGCVLALGLRGSHLRLKVLHGPGATQPAFRPAFRPIALSYASRLILERCGAWRGLDATPIEIVHVSQQGGFGQTRLAAADADVPALGYVVDYAALAARLLAQLDAEGIAPTAENISPRCTVHAEGASPGAQEKRYPQDALVARVRPARAAGNIAFERFTDEGPLALLPFAGAYAVVWSTRPERARLLCGLPDEAFLEELSAAAGARIGALAAVEARSIQPLSLRVLQTRVGPRAVYIGNAAQTLHPVAGQGLNLGLRDAWDLAQILREAVDPGDPAVLKQYESRRRLDVLATVRTTDLLASGFTGGGGLARAARGALMGAALCALDVLPGPRRFFARRMIFGSSALP